jgi:hypothetical protein
MIKKIVIWEYFEVSGKLIIFICRKSFEKETLWNSSPFHKNSYDKKIVVSVKLTLKRVSQKYLR